MSALDEARNALDLADCLLDAMQITLQHSQLLQLSLNFPAADEPAFKEAMTKSQGVAERLAYGVDEARGAIMHGAKSRARETLRRWQGYYDLAMGRLLAAKVRCYEYNWAWARMKRDPPGVGEPSIQCLEARPRRDRSV